MPIFPPWRPDHLAGAGVQGADQAREGRTPQTQFGERLGGIAAGIMHDGQAGRQGHRVGGGLGGLGGDAGTSKRGSRRTTSKTAAFACAAL